jgi:hypothetical protein
MHNMEYVITSNGKYLTDSDQWTLKIGFARVFRVKDRALAAAKRVDGTVEPYYGAPIKGQKAFTTPKQSPINRSSPYRSM